MANQAKQPTYTLNWVIGPDGKGEVVLTNSSLPVIPSKHTSVPCHDSHKPQFFSAKMDTRMSGNDNVVNLRLTSCGFNGEIDILVKFDESFLDLFTGETKVFFPMPIETPVVCKMTISGDIIVLTNSLLPVVEKIVITGEIQMEMKSKTPCFFKTKDDSAYRCSLPDECLTSIPCHEGLVPVKCSANMVWFDRLRFKISVVLLLSSKLLETPIYVQIDTPHSSFLDLFSGGKTNEVFFPLPISKKMFSVEVKDISNFKFKCLKGMPCYMKKREKNERMTRGAIGNDCDDPLPNTGEVQRPNQVWSTVSNCWELIRKPKPRDRDWKWDDSTTSWICKIDPITNLLIEFERTHYSNCWPKLPTTQQ